LPYVVLECQLKDKH